MRTARAIIILNNRISATGSVYADWNALVLNIFKKVNDLQTSDET